MSIIMNNNRYINFTQNIDDLVRFVYESEHNKLAYNCIDIANKLSWSNNSTSKSIIIIDDGNQSHYRSDYCLGLQNTGLSKSLFSIFR